MNSLPSTLLTFLLLSFACLIVAQDVAPKQPDKIIGGTPVPPGEFPFYCVSASDGFCGCSLITGDIILTAAHCLGAFRPGQEVYLGGILRDGSDATATVTIAETLKHPLYNDGNFDYDFLLLRINQDMSAVSVPALNLNAAVPPDGATTINFGFGATEDDFASDILLQVQLVVVNLEQCADQYSDLGEPIINDAMICAGGEFGRGSCYGDSGSPLMYDGKIVGVVTGGIECGDTIPAVYARVSKGASFIQRGVCDLTELTQPAFCAGLTNFPTMSPTNTPPTPLNDQCSDAKAITVGSTTIGSTISSSFDSVGFCGTINSGPGVWYKIVGDGSYYDIDTCSGMTNFDTRISIFKGACNARVCVTGNDQSSDFECRATGGSRASFKTETGVTYYILVHGNFEFKGKFELTVTSYTPPVNDLCADAITIGLVSTTTGSTIGATGDSAVTDGFDFGTAGVWYKTTGTDAMVEASICGLGSSEVDFALALFLGSSCGALSFSDGGIFSCDDQSQIFLEAGEVYYLLVQPAAFGDEGVSFELRLTDPSPAEGGGSCNIFLAILAFILRIFTFGLVNLCD